MEMTEISFKYTQDEYVKAERQYLFGSKTITKTSVAVLTIYLLFSIMYLFLSAYSEISIIFLGIALFALVTGDTLYFYIPVYKFKKTSKYSTQKSIFKSGGQTRFRENSIIKPELCETCVINDDNKVMILLP
ncbi:hypothetical protein acsn021_20250 [Anaerocolumna cellulosilytica]|uniref:Uncharacterized protein n=1 Tax=Anaerocolumna cellulosilytica TaxID=433286 RepID=A0A6S6QXJ7_9FIRM|nr:hypothetical protein [Anaerocolumna cellulosilytica]MBB5196422.1 hypothetical protein [Anaerocolumna cellulosilytica]BCJ94456.1 hypothetical protein acsn021_20250 [Anaerocolumna cellulosilytica]